MTDFKVNFSKIKTPSRAKEVVFSDKAKPSDKPIIGSFRGKKVIEKNDAKSSVSSKHSRNSIIDKPLRGRLKNPETFKPGGVNEAEFKKALEKEKNRIKKAHPVFKEELKQEKIDIIKKDFNAVIDNIYKCVDKGIAEYVLVKDTYNNDIPAIKLDNNKMGDYLVSEDNHKEPIRMATWTALHPTMKDLDEALDPSDKKMNYFFRKSFIPQYDIGCEPGDRGHGYLVLHDNIQEYAPKYFKTKINHLVKTNAIPQDVFGVTVEDLQSFQLNIFNRDKIKDILAGFKANLGSLTANTHTEKGMVAYKEYIDDMAKVFQEEYKNLSQENKVFALNELKTLMKYTPVGRKAPKNTSIKLRSVVSQNGTVQLPYKKPSILKRFSNKIRNRKIEYDASKDAKNYLKSLLVPTKKNHIPNLHQIMSLDPSWSFVFDGPESKAAGIQRNFGSK